MPKLNESPCQFAVSGKFGRPAINSLWIAGTTNLALPNWLTFRRQGELCNVRGFRGGSVLSFRAEHSHDPRMGTGEVVATQVLLEIGRAIRNTVIDIPGGEDAHT